jgi:endogenous inhibitor of DNA gyrase (YacG/DUF329 family)
MEKKITDYQCTNCNSDMMYATSIKDNEGNGFCSKECRSDYLRERNQELMSAGG